MLQQDDLNFNGIVEPPAGVRRATPRPAPPRRDGTITGRMAGVVDPELESYVNSIIEDLRARGFDVRIGETRRGLERQREHVAAGRSQTMDSRHLTGHGVDLIVFENGRPQWDTNHAGWQAIGEAAERRGLRWGGRFSFRDYGHVEIPRTAAVTAVSAVSDDELNFDGIVEGIKSFDDESFNFEGIVEPFEEEAGETITVDVGGARPQPQALEFQPDTPEQMRSRLPILQEAARGAMALANPAPRLPDDHPDLLSAPVTLTLPVLEGGRRPSSAEVTAAYLDHLGPEWRAVANRYEAETGRPLLHLRAEPRSLRRGRGGWQIELHVPQGSMRVLNAYAEGGREAVAAEVERIRGQRRQSTDAAAQAEQERAGQGFIANQVEGARLALADAGLRSAQLAQNIVGGGDTETQAALDAAQTALEEQPQSITRVGANLVAEGSRAALGAMPYAALSVAQEAHQGQEAALGSGAVAGGVGLVARGAGHGVRALRNRGRVDSTPMQQPSTLGLNSARAGQPTPPASAVRPGRASETSAREITEQVEAANAPAVVAEVVEGIPVRPVVPRGRIGQAVTNAAGAIDNTVGAVARSPVGTVARGMSDAASFSRSVLASADISAPGRQALPLSLADIPKAARAFRQQLRAFVSARAYAETPRRLLTSRHAELMERAGLRRASLDGGQETFTSNLARHVPGVGRSERAMNAYLDEIRASHFEQYADEFIDAGMTFETHPEQFRALARWLNRSTGYGDFDLIARGARRVAGRDLPELERAVEGFANLGIFAPRLTASRIQLLNPHYYYSLPPEVRRIALRQQMRFVGTVAGTMGLFRLMGAEVNVTDPNDSDWMRVRVGNTRYDLLGGYQQSLRFFYRFGRAVEREARGEQLQPHERSLYIAGRFLRSKVSPAASYATDAATGETFIGEPFEPLGHVRDEQGRVAPSGGVPDRLIPLFAQDLADAMREHGLIRGAAMGAPSGVGIGTSTYDKEADRARRSARRRRARAPERERESDDSNDWRMR